MLDSLVAAYPASVRYFLASKAKSMRDSAPSTGTRSTEQNNSRSTRKGPEPGMGEIQELEISEMSESFAKSPQQSEARAGVREAIERRGVNGLAVKTDPILRVNSAHKSLDFRETDAHGHRAGVSGDRPAGEVRMDSAREAVSASTRSTILPQSVASSPVGGGVTDGEDSDEMPNGTHRRPLTIRTMGASGGAPRDSVSAHRENGDVLGGPGEELASEEERRWRELVPVHEKDVYPNVRCVLCEWGTINRM